MTTTRAPMARPLTDEERAELDARAELMTCEICDRAEPKSSHRCRFERGCLCWYGRPCGPESDGPDSWDRTARIAGAAGHQLDGDPRDLA